MSTYTTCSGRGGGGGGGGVGIINVIIYSYDHFVQKLCQIEQLKQQQEEGKQLEANQVSGLLMNGI